MKMKRRGDVKQESQIVRNGWKTQWKRKGESGVEIKNHLGAILRKI